MRTRQSLKLPTTKTTPAKKNAETNTKPAEKKMTIKEREALKDSIIAKAKRDAEAAKTKEKK